MFVSIVKAIRGLRPTIATHGANSIANIGHMLFPTPRLLTIIVKIPQLALINVNQLSDANTN